MAADPAARDAAAVLTERAPAKINLCLFVGPTRDDGRHELVTVFEPLTLHDTVTLQPADGDEDEVVCPGVEGPNLAGRALAAFRAATGWDGPPVRLEIAKRIPVAAGMAGGSADAAAALRLAHRASGLGGDDLLLELARGLGADVPGQVRPARLLATGAGEHLRPLAGPAAPYGVLVLPSSEQLATPAVFGEADRLGLPRDAGGLAAALAEVERAAEPPIVNELEPAARSLCPSIDGALAAARDAGARHALVSGSGPTVLGLFSTPAAARRAAEALAGRTPAPIVAEPLTG
jgi:4-diphosphocytidyl-2-C-methyl-D-erythritol kinase